MAEGKWVTVPSNLTRSGNAERRFQMKSGQLRETEPNSAEWYDQMYKQPFQGMLKAPGSFGRAMERLINQGGGDVTPLNNPPGSGSNLDSSLNPSQGADLDMDAIKRLAAEFDKKEPAPSSDLNPPAVSDDANSSDSALTSMRQQYAPGADIWSTDEGKAILEAARTNSYGGKDQGTLAEFNTQQRQAGIGANPEIIEALGYEGNMAEWAKANPALAMREYNKKFGNSYEGEGSGDANSVLANGMTAGEDARHAAMSAAAIMNGTGQITESNNQQTSEIQNTGAQSIGGLNGMNMLQETMRKHFQNAAKADRVFKS